MKNLIEAHIRDNRFDSGIGSSFHAIFEECGGEIPYLETYLDIVKPDKDTLAAMISSLSPTEVVARSYLIGRSSDFVGGLDDLML